MDKYIKAAVGNISELSSEDRADVASDPNVPIDYLVELADDVDYHVRAAVADNPNCPPDILDKLSDDPSFDVRLNVASNHNTAGETLRDLSYDSFSSIRCASYVKYEVELMYCGMIGASATLEIEAPYGADADELMEFVRDEYDADLYDFLNVDNTEYLGDNEWEITFNFNGFMGCDATYTVDGDVDDEDDAIGDAYLEAMFDFTVESFEYLGR